MLEFTNMKSKAMLSKALVGSAALIGDGEGYKKGKRIDRLGRYSRQLMLFLAILLPALIAGCGHWDENPVAADETAPTVILSAPANSATSVLIDSKPAATFSEAMDQSSITTSTFTLKQGTTPIYGNVTYDNSIATFAPSIDLTAGTVYTATITTGAKDMAGNTLASDFVWSFTTAAAVIVDVTSPTVMSTVPADAATGVAINLKPAATFSEAMDQSTITAATYTLKQGTTSVSGTVTYTGTVATFTPTAALTSGTVYTATITTGVKDLAGNALASNHVWTFTTAAAADVTPPTVVSTVPVNAATGVAINSKPAATFSESMDQSTITAATYTLKQGTTSVSGTVTYTGTVATFTPTAALTSGTVYTATITTGVKDLAGNALASNHVWTFTTAAAADVTPPTVVSTVPVNAATGVAINSKPAATFSEAMDQSTITAATYTLKQGTTSVSGTVTYTGTVATFTPTAALAANTVYTATITTGVKDVAGNALASDFVWSFTTAAAVVVDETAPTVMSTVPADAATGVALNSKPAATFSESMDQSTITAATYTLKQGTTSVSGTVTYTGTVATFTPTAALAANTVYTATITTGVKDVAGNTLATNYVWSFTTAAAVVVDETAPTVMSTVPADAAVDVAINSKPAATFSEAMDQSTISSATYTLKQGTTPISGEVTYDNSIATFAPEVDLLAGTEYTATITTGAKDLAGNALVNDYVWTFTTAEIVLSGQLPVPLGSAANFAILSHSAISNIPSSAITGDVGLSPGSRSSITGLTLPEVNGIIFAADDAAPVPSMLIAAKTDAQIAFDNARAAVRGTPTPISGNINGLTLVPGLYESGTSIEISPGGFLYLDAQGDANAVFIIRSATTITTESTSQVVLAGNANPANIFWTAGSAITLGANSIMKGTLIAGTSISLQTLARLDGRALIQGAAAGQVSLDQATIILP